MTSLNDIPAGPHFAIIRTTSVYIPGDERSRTNPGHGYPASTETYITYQAFASREQWEAEVVRLTQGREPFRAISATPAKVTTSVNVRVE